MARQRPNVLLITTDQQRFDTLGCNGNPHIRTPNLDRLAADGVNLRRHTTSCPLCTPARVSILTGKYHRTHGARQIGDTLDSDARGVSHILTDAGYSCGVFGKTHFEPAQSLFAERMDHSTPYYGFEEFRITEDNQVGEYLGWVKSEHPQHWDDVRRNTVQAPGDSAEPLPDRGDNRPWDAFVSSAPEELHQTHWITDHTIDFIRSRAAAGRAFFGWCSYVDPHHPFNPPERYASMYDPADLPIPPPREKAPLDFPRLYNDYSSDERMTTADYQRMKAHYYAMVTHIDANVGRILECLTDEGVLENTIILFTSDHGDYCGDHGLIRKGRAMYDNLLRVPMLVRLPNRENAGAEYDSPTQHEDIVPTVLEWVGVDVPGEVQGISFADPLRGRGPSGRKYAFFENEWSRAIGVSNGRWKLMHYPEETTGIGFVLTDTEDDPLEYENLAGAAEHAAIEHELKKALFEHMLNLPIYRPKSDFIY